MMMAQKVRQDKKELNAAIALKESIIHFKVSPGTIKLFVLAKRLAFRYCMAVKRWK
jgi:hypothetical protein